MAEVARVHDLDYVVQLQEFCDAGGGQLDADTAVNAASWEAARLAAGAGLAAIEALEAGEGSSAFLAVRPPGHHAVPAHAMGFCLLNNVAVAAAALREQGQRVLILDWDAHHGNGTQDMFWDDANVLYISLHQSPLYPGTGALHDIGFGPGRGTTINVPFPPGTTGDAYSSAFARVIEPAADRFRPDWVLVSAGFDAHAADPLTDLGLASGDFAEMMSRTLDLAPLGRCVVFLEGGYDLGALEASVVAMCGVLIGSGADDCSLTDGAPSSALRVIDAVKELHNL